MKRRRIGIIEENRDEIFYIVVCGNKIIDPKDIYEIFRILLIFRFNILGISVTN